MDEGDRLERVWRWGSAYNQVMKNDMPESRAAYTKAYREAYQRRECMICGRHMDHPQLHRRLNPKDQSAMGPDFLAHRECFHKRVREAGFDPDAVEPVGVEPGDTLVSNTIFERRQGPSLVVIERNEGGFVGGCRICDTVTQVRATKKDALADLRAHAIQEHRGDIEGNWR